MALATVTVKYFGTNVGKIYFSDVDRRRQLGGAPEGGNYKAGQDEYIVWGEVKVLQLTDDVLYSRLNGVLKYFSTEASSIIFSSNGAPLTIVDGVDTAANEVPRGDFSNTGLFDDRFIQNNLNGNYTTGIKGTLGTGATGYYIGGDTGYNYGNVL
jgi:hypothetical protein